MIKLQQLQNTIRGKRTEVRVSSILGELVGAEKELLTSAGLALMRKYWVVLSAVMCVFCLLIVHFIACHSYVFETCVSCPMLQLFPNMQMKPVFLCCKLGTIAVTDQA